MSFFSYISSKLQRRTNSLKYIPLVDGIRFLAIGLVIIQHLNERVLKYGINESTLSAQESEFSYILSRGSIGVLIFFILSGFIISLPFAKGKTFIDNFSFKSFYTRRLTRLEPPYIIWMSIFAVVLLVSTSTSMASMIGHFLASIFYLHNIAYSSFSIINPVAWSLEVEIQFYLISPLICILYFSMKQEKLRRSLLVFSIISFMTAQHLLGWQLLPFKASLLGQFQHFLVGILLADLYWAHHTKKIAGSVVYDGLFLIFLTIMAFTWTEEYLKSLIFEFSAFSLFLTLYKGVYFPRLLSLKWISIIGGMCYTIYLIHLPLLEGIGKIYFLIMPQLNYLSSLLMFTIIALPIVLAISIIGFLLIEKPFMTNDLQIFRFLKLRNLLFHLKIKQSLLNRFFFAATLVFLATPLLGQTVTGSKPIDINKILSLDEILFLADNSSMLAKSYNAEKAEIEEDIKVLKKDWMDNIFLTSNMNYGNGSYSDEVYNGSITGQSFLSRQKSAFNVGVNIYLPLSRVTSKHNQIRSRNHHVESIEYKKLHHLDQRHQTIIHHYKELLYNIKAIAIHSEKVEVNNSAYELANRYYKAGQIEMKEYQGTIDAFYSAKLDYEKAMNETFYCLRLLEELVGISIIKK